MGQCPCGCDNGRGDAGGCVGRMRGLGLWVGGAGVAVGDGMRWRARR